MSLVNTAPYGQMYLPMSDEWIPTLSQPLLQIGTYAEIWYGISNQDAEVANTLLQGPIPVVAGTVTIDRNNTIRRSASNVTLLPSAGGELLPIANQPADSAFNLFAPYGAEMRLYKGVQESGTPPTIASVTATSPPTLPLVVSPATYPFVTAESPPMLPLTVVTGVNDTFADNDGLTWTVAPGTYTTIDDLVTALNNAGYIYEGTFEMTFSEWSATFATDGTYLTLTYYAAGTANNDTYGIISGDITPYLGFDLPAMLGGAVDANNTFGVGTYYPAEDVTLYDTYTLPFGTISDIDELTTMIQATPRDGETSYTPMSNFLIWSNDGTYLTATSVWSGSLGDNLSLVSAVGISPTGDGDVLASLGFVSGTSLTGGVDGVNWTNASVTGYGAFPFYDEAVITEGVNDSFTLTYDGGSYTFTCPPGTYSQPAEGYNFGWQDVVLAFARDDNNDCIGRYCEVNNNIGEPITLTLWGGGASGNSATLSGNMLSDIAVTSPSQFSGGANENTEYAMLGVFEIHEVDVIDDSTGVTLVGTLQDRADLIQRRGFAAPYSTDGISTVDIAILSIIWTVLGWTEFPFPLPVYFAEQTFVPAVSSYDVGDDPWEACVELAQTAGQQLYFDYSGTLQLCPLPDPSTGTPCITYVEGSTPSAVSIKRVISNDSMPNVIIVQQEGSNSSSQFTCYWWDSNPDSPTYYGPAPEGGFSPGPVTTLPEPDPTSRYPATIQLVSTSLIPDNTVSYTASATNGTSTLTLTVAQGATLVVGMGVKGAGITGSATITAISIGTSAVVTISGTIGTLTASSYSFTAIGSTRDEWCQALANAAGILAIGSIENTTITLRDNPAHDVDDIVAVQRVKSGVFLGGLLEEPSPMNYVLDQVQIDLGVKTPLSITGRPCIFYGDG